ncbi:MAG: S-layer homology domain-containing protein [Oscillospiraceae bacterium]|jgi:hypothetical protein|nr:S-layer homology domain-containing protein [Oscillospiraceae bacterium]
MKKRVIAILLALVLTLPTLSGAFAASKSDLDSAVTGAAAYMLKTVKKTEVGSVGGEWAVIGLARSGYDVPDAYYEAYYKAVEKYVRDSKGVLHDKKYTEYSRVILGLTAAGYDPRDVGGYDLTAPLGDFEKTIWQGINGPIWALIALDSGNYASALRDKYIAEILRRQLDDGGWNLTADGSNPKENSSSDLTGMALQALANYADRPDVKAAVDRALAYLSKTQNAGGGYSFAGDVSSESVVQVLVGITALGVSVDDPRFVKNGKTLVDNILSFKNADGSFNHTTDGSGNSQMSTEQAFYGLVAAQRARDGRNALYNMSDAVKRGVTGDTAPGLPGKHADVNAVPVTKPSTTFDDVKNHANKAAIEALAAREVVGGKGDNNFDPNGNVTRAEFAAIATRGLGLAGGGVPDAPFADVAGAQWYAKPVAVAAHYGIVKGTSATTFNPTGNITRQDAAVMVARAAKLAGLDTAQSDAQIRDTLAQFGDYRTVADYAKESLAFCYAAGILDDSEFDIEPAKAATRAEIAEMVYRLLDKAELL